MLAQLRGKLIISALLGLGVAVALGLVSDARAVSASLANFAWPVLPAVVAGTLVNYALRWLKWDYYLRALGQHHGLRRADSVLIFTSGLLMAVTPAKLGEVLKSALLKRRNGTPLSASAPIVVAERLTDGLAMLLLLGSGLTLYAPARPAFVVLLVLTVIGLLAVQSQALVMWALGLLERVPRGARLTKPLLTAYESTQTLMHWRILLPATVLSLVSWFGECVAFYYVLLGLGVTGDTLWLLTVATFVFAASTLAGLVSFLPGGLGVSEASSTGLLMLLGGIGSGAATAATLLIRFCTLWLGVLLGALALALFSKLRGEEPRAGVEHEEGRATAVSPTS